jgi:hypothetical protein
VDGALREEEFFGYAAVGEAGVVRAFGVQDLDLEAAGAEGLGEAFQVALIPRAPLVGVADDYRFHCHTISPILE